MKRLICSFTKNFFLIKIILLFFSFTIHAIAIDLNIPKTEDEWGKAYNSVNWKQGPSTVNFNDAKSKITVGSNFSILEGNDVNQWLYWTNGIKFPNVKIYVVDIDEGSQYYFQFSDSGYVKTDDWIDVKPDKFIKEIREKYETNNADREKNNQPTITNVSWLYKPYLDKNYDTVYYALNIGWSDSQITEQGTAIILGREGYTMGSYVAGDSGYQEQMLLNLSNIHTFNSTKQYKDWKSGDKVAAAGIGALLATTLGVKALKPGIIAAALILLKKFWFIILLPFILAGKLFSGLFNKKK